MSEAAQETSRFERFADRFYLRKVYLGSGFDIDRAVAIQAQIVKLMHDGDDPIVLEIDCVGGYLSAASYLRDTILEYRQEVPIYGLVTSRAFSAAAYVLQTCTRRFALRGSELALHVNVRRLNITPFSGKIRVLLDAWKAEGAVRRSYADMVADYISHLPRLSRGEVIALMREARKISAQEALELGIIDEILEVRYPRV